MLLRRLLSLALMLALTTMGGVAVRAANIQYVGTNGDGNAAVTDCATQTNADCTLRDALAATANGGTLALGSHFNPANPIILTQGPLTVNRDVTIQGQGNLVVDGGQTARVFNVTAGTVEMDGVTIQGGLASDQGAGINETGGSLTLNGCLVTNNVVFSATGSALGGGIFALSDLTLINTTVSHNDDASAATSGQPLVYGGGIASYGGTLRIIGSTITVNETHNPTNQNAFAQGAGIYSLNALVLTNSTVSDNMGVGQASGNEGGGITVQAGTATLASSTITRNSVAGAVGGIFDESAIPFSLTDTLIAGNMAPDAPDVAGATTSTSRNNLIGVGDGLSGITNGTNGNQIGTGASPLDAKLDPTGLQANGSTGPQTVALLRNSPAIEAGNACPAGVSTDERGQPRVGACDIGAYEYQPATPTLQNATGPAAGGNVTFIGTGFQTGATVNVGGTSLTAPASGVSADGTQLVLTVPAHTAGMGTLALINPGNVNAAVATFTYTPVISSLSPSSGSSLGGGSVTITGAGFGTDPAHVGVTFGTASATVTSISNSQIVVAAPPGSGRADITVTVNGVSATKTGAYTYGTVNPLPSSPPTVAPASGGNPLPASRSPVGSASGSAPASMPRSRP